MKNIRDYGYGVTPKPTATPKAEPANAPFPCPNCGCNQLMKITVPVELQGGNYLSNYMGCPACTWASPSINTKEKT